MKLNNTFKRELTSELKKLYPLIEIKHEDSYISLKWKEFSNENSMGIQVNWIGIRNGGKNQSTVLNTFGISGKNKSEYYKKVEVEVLDYAQKFLDKWIKEDKEIF
jgi:hypothetical protein